METWNLKMSESCKPVPTTDSIFPYKSLMFLNCKVLLSLMFLSHGHGISHVSIACGGLSIYGTQWILINPFTPKSNQFRILHVSPSSPKILHHRAWRTWLLIAYSDERWLYYRFSLPRLYVFLWKVGRTYFLNLGVKGLKWTSVMGPVSEEKVHSLAMLAVCPYLARLQQPDVGSFSAVRRTGGVWEWRGSRVRWWLIDRSINQSSIQSINHWINQSSIQSIKRFNQSINQSINQSTFQSSIIHSINQSLNQSIIHSINQSTFQSINYPFNQSIKQTVQSIKQSINQPFNQSIIHSINQPINQANRSINQPINQPIKQSINQQSIKQTAQSID